MQKILIKYLYEVLSNRLIFEHAVLLIPRLFNYKMCYLALYKQILTRHLMKAYQLAKEAVSTFIS